MPEMEHDLRKVYQSARELMSISEVQSYSDKMLPGIQSVRETARRMTGASPTIHARNETAGLGWGGRRAGYTGGLIKGFGMGDIGVSLPANAQIGDRRGFTSLSPEVLTKVKGHTDGEGGEGEFSLKHKGDKVKLGSKTYPTAWYVHKRINESNAIGQKTGWKTDWQRRYDLGADQYQDIENLEDSRTDIDIYITLLSVGKTADEETAYQKSKTDAFSAIANAKGQATKLKAIGGDDAAIQKSITAAQTAYDKADYTGALSSALAATSQAIDAIALKEKLNLEAEKAKIQADPSIDQKTKDNMKADIDAQKDVIDQRAATDKAEQVPEGTGFKLDFKNPMVIGGIIAVISIAVVGGVAAAVMSKKKK